jgi:hypothetical protein
MQNQANQAFQQAPINQAAPQANAPFQAAPAQQPQTQFMNNFFQLLQQLQPQQQVQMLGWLLPALNQLMGAQQPAHRLV